MNGLPTVLLHDLASDPRARRFAETARQRKIVVVPADAGLVEHVPAARVASGKFEPDTDARPVARRSDVNAVSPFAPGRFLNATRAHSPPLGPEVAVIIAPQSLRSEESDKQDENAGMPGAGTLTVERLTALLDDYTSRSIPALVWGLRTPLAQAPRQVEFVSAETNMAELFGRLITLARYAPMVSRLERELLHLERLGKQLNRYFAEVDQELRLAGRLQHDFLPRETFQIEGLTCAALFQPATWVSGDLYDIFRIDERHAGLFVADAMGHGLAAGIMTMFLRQTLHIKEIDGHSYRIHEPAAALELLHNGLARQGLQNQNFVTAVYATLNTTTFELRVARGGHPYPLLISRGGEIQELRPDGPLLGIPDMPAEFEEARLMLAPGDKLVLFTDGLEDVLLLQSADEQQARAHAGRNSAAAGPPQIQQTLFSPLLHELAPLDARQFVAALRGALDRREGSLNPADDMTLVVIERSLN